MREKNATNRANGSSRGSLSTSRATGPKTEVGKRRSKYNAIRHGFFANCLLPEESEAEYRRLEAALRARYSSDNPVARFLVSKLAMVMWQQRRLARIERDTIFRTSCPSEEERTRRHLSDGDKWLRSEEAKQDGLFQRQDNLVVVTVCLNVLTVLKRVIAERGCLEPNEDRPMLGFIYGKGGALTHPPVAEYEMAARSGKRCGANEEAEKDGDSTPPLKDFLEALDMDIELLRTQKNRLRMDLEIGNECHPLPEEKNLELILRYRSMLDRSFERILSQLETLRGLDKEGLEKPSGLHVERFAV